MDLITNDHSIEVGIRELKNQLSHFIDQVCAGKEIIVTEHGKPVARLTALTEADDRLTRLIASGAVRPAIKSKNPRPRGRFKATGSVSEIVINERR
ncbi:MAG: type II toxin-antitoxin system prevent-host-death family antitoxin [Actinobacteria bacterium]|nr:MAG: type II toxin-antitoxin system prevent-host-death family antitoxin [Actinomycetota bacterium]